MNSKDKGKSKLGLLGVAAAVILVVIVEGAVFMKRYAPSTLMQIRHRIVLLL